ncbi:hypothetical protein N9A28_01205 [Sulfurimonas sp.]|nr:hypothetical protein [Sulfurimonas sp.]
MKLALILLIFITNLYSCAVYTNHVPIADVYVSIDAQKEKTTFTITWDFKEFFIASLDDHDLNENGKFDENEKEDIRDEWIDYAFKNNHITELVYTNKDKRIRKSLMSKIDVHTSNLTVSKDNMKYVYSFDTDFIIEENNKIFIRFLDDNEKINLALKSVTVENYNGPKTVLPQDIRANIYFYDHKVKYRKKN